MIYLQLFWSFIQIGMFSFGGGYAAMPLIQGQVVTDHGWLTMSEFTDLITISQMTPGPIAVNSATFVGLKISNTWMYFAVLYYCDSVGKIVLEIPEYGYATGSIVFTSSGSSGDDCISWNFDSYDGLLGKQYDNFYWNKMGHGIDFCHMCSYTAKNKDESYLGYGIGRGN